MGRWMYNLQFFSSWQDVRTQWPFHSFLSWLSVGVIWVKWSHQVAINFQYIIGQTCGHNNKCQGEHYFLSKWPCMNVLPTYFLQPYLPFPSKEMLQLEGVRHSYDGWWWILAAGNKRWWFDRAAGKFGMTGDHDPVWTWGRVNFCFKAPYLNST